MENTIDMFEHYDKLPKKVQVVLDKFSDMDNTYDNCGKLVDALNKVGWTCEYYLDAEPCYLRKLSKFDEWTNDKVEKVFELLTDELSFAVSTVVKKVIRTREEKIRYFIKNEENFKKQFK